MDTPHQWIATLQRTLTKVRTISPFNSILQHSLKSGHPTQLYSHVYTLVSRSTLPPSQPFLLLNWLAPLRVLMDDRVCLLQLEWLQLEQMGALSLIQDWYATSSRQLYPIVVTSKQITNTIDTQEPKSAQLRQQSSLATSKLATTAFSVPKTNSQLLVQ